MLSTFERYLTVDERQRAARFVNARDCYHFIAGRGILRAILARYLGRPPANVDLTYEPAGKPRLQMRESDRPIWFNLAHSRGLAVYAFSETSDVGVDVEAVRADIVTDDIADRFFSRREVAELRTLPRQEQHEAFFACWARKEAYVKARGSGLGMALDSFVVSVRPGELQGFVSGEGTRWGWRSFWPAEEYVGAVVAAGSDWKLRCWEWHPQSRSESGT